MQGLKRLFFLLLLSLAALQLALPQSYSITAEQLAALERELETQRAELRTQKELLDGQEALLERLNKELQSSAEELRNSQEALQEARQALSEARVSLKKYAGKKLGQAVIAGAVSLVVGAAAGIAGGYFIGK